MRMDLSGGFSIVELVAVIAIVGILAVTALPRFFDLGTFQEREFYDQAVAAVRYAQKLAVATHCTVRVQFTANSGFALYWPANVNACTTGPYTTAVPDPTGAATTFTRTAPSGVTLTAANFSFAAGGGADSDVTVNVGSRSFLVHAVTGFVQEL